METKERIIEASKELFFRLGIRSVTMDDIANHLGMSKKTLYQHFSDKDELVDTLVENEIGVMQTEIQSCCFHASNAVEEVLHSMEMSNRHFSNLNPMVLFDLHKFHFESFKKFTNHKNTFLFEIIRTNILRGIEEGLYRKDINAELLSRFRLNMLLMPFNMEVFPPAQFNLNEISNAMTENFLYGLATEKGFEVIESYKQRKKQHDQ